MCTRKSRKLIKLFSNFFTFEISVLGLQKKSIPVSNRMASEVHIYLNKNSRYSIMSDQQFSVQTVVTTNSNSLNNAFHVYSISN